MDEDKMKKDRRARHLDLIENLIYLIIWIFILGTPVWGEYRYVENGIDWGRILRMWITTSPILILFILNNYLLLPFFLARKKAKAYLFFAGCLLLSLVLLNVLQQGDREHKPQETGRPPIVARQDPPSTRPEPRAGQTPPPPRQEGPERSHRSPDDRPGKPSEELPFIYLPMLPMPIFLSPMVIGIFVIGLNLGIKFLFKSIRDDQRLKELEKHNLRTELEYLKHQINPHFFMNTLNNIHALIDIDPEKAKDTVLELSKMMRYVLYESAKPDVLLSREIQFLNNYIELMRLRYTDQIEIRVSVPDDIPDVQVPPLLFISFVENAFKHGVSYQHASFIHIAIEIDTEKRQLLYRVDNSDYQDTSSNRPGIGLDNVRKRLDLLYGHDYTLDIKRDKNAYHVSLLIPLAAL